MTDWALRKDIDRVKQFANEIDNALAKNNINSIRELLETIYDQSDVDIFTAKLNKDLNNLDTNLVTLKANLIEFNGALIDFDDSNDNLQYDLSKLKENLLAFVDVLGVLDVDLRDLESSLNDLNGQVNGDSTHTGFLTYVQELQTNIYGGSGYSINNPSPSSLKGTLNSFSEQLSDLSSGDTKLALTLSALTGYLTTFKGTLSEFQDKIIEDYGQSYYDGLDEEIVKLVGAITSANQDIEDHQDLIDSVQDTIGQSSDTGNSTLFGKLYNTNATATSASNSANAVTNTVNNTITPQLNTVRNTDIPNVKNKMGYNNIPSGQTLQGQINNQQDELGTQTGRIDTLEDETIPDLSDKIGDVDVANDGSLADQVLTNGGDVSDVKEKIGYNNIPSGKTLQGQINTTDGKIGTVPTGQTLQGQITTHTNQIGTVPSGKTLQSQITSTDNKIGNISTDDETDGTVFGWINKTLNDLEDTDEKAENLQNLSYGKNNGGTIAQPTSDSLQGKINTAQGNITNLQSDLGDAQEQINTVDNSLNTILTPSSTLQFTWVYVTDGDVEPTEINKFESMYGITITYAYSYNGASYYRKSGNNWVAGSASGNLEIGVCSENYFPRRVAGNEGFEYIYDIRLKSYRHIYKDPQYEDVLGYYGEWEYLEELPDFFNQTELYYTIANHFSQKSHTHTKSQITDFSHTHTIANITNLQTVLNGKSDSSHTHDTWTETTLWSSGNNYTILWVNEAIKMCHLKYYQQNVSVTTSEKTLHTALIPASYRPAYTVISGCWHPNVSIAVANTGNIICVGSESATRTVNGNLIWNY